MTSQHNRLTRGQAAARIGISEPTLMRMRTKGTGPEYLKLGGRVFYEAETIDEWVNQQRRTQTNQNRIKRTPEQPAA